MKPGFGFGKPEGGLRNIRHYLGLVSLLLLITACLGIQVIAFLASARGHEILTGVRVLSKSTADYSFDEILQLAPILPGILDDLEQDPPFQTPGIATPPAIGQVIPSVTSTVTTPGIITTITPPNQTTIPTVINTGNPTPGTTVTTTSPSTIFPTTPVPTITATTRTPTPVVTTPVPTTRVPTTPVPTTSVPTTQVPSTQVPTTSVPTTAVPTTPVPTPIQPTNTPTPTDIIEFPTPIQTPSDEPTLVAETPPGNGLDVFSTREPSIQLVPSLWSLLLARTGSMTWVCTIPTF